MARRYAEAFLDAARGAGRRNSAWASRRMAESITPAWLIPIQNTMLVRKKAHMTGSATDPKADEGFPGRVMAPSAVVGGIFLVFLLLQFPPAVPMGFLVGIGVGMLAFWAWNLLVRKLIRQDRESVRAQGMLWVALLTLVKLPVLGGLLAFGILYLEVNLFALAGGTTLVPAVVVLKVLGRALFHGSHRVAGGQVI